MAKANFVCVAVPGMTDNKTTVMTPNGKVLSEEGRPDGVMAAALKAWATVPLDERKPKKVTPLEDYPDPPQPPTNALILKTYSRALLRDDKGKLGRPAKQTIGDGGYSWNAEPQTDFVWFSEAEWKALVVPDAAKGKTHPVPPEIVQKIGTFHLLDKGLGTPDFYWDKAAGELTLTVEEATTAGQRLALEGEIRLGDKAYPVRFRGKLTYDAKKQAFTKVDLVALGKDDGDQRPPEQRKARNKTRYVVPAGSTPLLAVTYERVDGTALLDRVPPYAIMYDSAKNYGKPYLPK